MKNMEKREYDGLQTTRLTVESPDIMATSNSKIKVKTQDISSSTTEWEEVPDAGTLSTTITNSF